MHQLGQQVDVSKHMQQQHHQDKRGACANPKNYFSASRILSAPNLISAIKRAALDNLSIANATCLGGASPVDSTVSIVSCCWFAIVDGCC
ncbi:hypothetical protein C5167_046127 [Papaver somniferum]|uniref:Uncharacterized protein n=1 Tax=Papaver somniferum TaxID=3469 RepID=A0A4Y7LGJ2_PAPSO|nr:hypothetical protein C5167_046127 [Papaver somniferum]